MIQRRFHIRKLERLEPRRLLTWLTDFDMDGDLDGFNNIAWYQNVDGNGNLRELEWPFAISPSDRIDAADFDGDGFDDAIVFSERKLVWYENIGGKWNATVEHFVGEFDETELEKIKIIDVLNDGDMDVIAITQASVHLYSNDGTGRLRESDVLSIDTDDPEKFFQDSGDLDNDGDLDIVYQLAGRERLLELRRNLGNGDFETEILNGGFRRVDVIDFDGDGFQDILYKNLNDHRLELHWYQNVGGTLAESRLLMSNAATADSGYLGFTDFDGDGDLDVTTWVERTQLIWRNETDSIERLNDVYAWWSLDPGDINGDGVIDLPGQNGWWIDGATSLLHINQKLRLAALQPGDANRDLIFDESDLIQVAKSQKFQNESPATWEQGDWDGAPSGINHVPPTGDGVFDAQDLNLAYDSGFFRKGAYSGDALQPSHQRRYLRNRIDDTEVVVHYDFLTGNVTVHSERRLSSLHLHSKSGQFVATEPGNLVGRFDVNQPDSQFRFDLDGFDAAELSAQLPTELLSHQVTDHLTVDGSYVDGSELGNIVFRCTGCEADIDALQRAIRNQDEPRFDVNHDGMLDEHDLRHVLSETLRTSFGDSNLDGVFDTKDLVQVFVAGEFEDSTMGNSTWEDGDWNGDGDFNSTDLSLAFEESRFADNYHSNPVELGEIQFSLSPIELNVGESVHIIDYDSDGDNDILTIRDGKPIWIENLNNAERFHERELGIEGVLSIATGDINGDKHMDVVVRLQDRYEWFRGNGDGDFSAPTVITYAYESNRGNPSIDIVDFDRDGDADLLLGEYGIIEWVENINGRGSFNPPVVVDMLFNEWANDFVDVVAADTDDDDDPDIVINSFFYGVQIFTNDAGEFIKPKTAIFGNARELLASVADVDGDGSLDLVFRDGPWLMGWRPNEGGVFREYLPLPLMYENSILGDLDGDGDLDQIQASQWYEFDDGFLPEPKPISDELDMWPVALADFDNDGDIDMIARDRNATYLLTNTAIDE